MGSAADAEETVQDAFSHWQAADRQRIKVPETCQVLDAAQTPASLRGT
ncbi:hypothetical protein [Streptosporangium canum]